MDAQLIIKEKKTYKRLKLELIGGAQYNFYQLLYQIFIDLPYKIANINTITGAPIVYKVRWLHPWLKALVGTSRSKERFSGSTPVLLASRAQIDSNFRTLKRQEKVVAITLLEL